MKKEESTVKEQARVTAGSRPAKPPTAANARAEREETLCWSTGSIRAATPWRAVRASGPPSRPKKCIACTPAWRAAGRNPWRYHPGSRSSSAAPWEKASEPSHHNATPVPAQHTARQRVEAARLPSPVLRESHRAAGRTAAAASHPAKKGPRQGSNTRRAASTAAATAAQNTTHLTNPSRPIAPPLPASYCMPRPPK